MYTSKKQWLDVVIYSNTYCIVDTVAQLESYQTHDPSLVQSQLTLTKLLSIKFLSFHMFTF